MSGFNDSPPSPPSLPSAPAYTPLQDVIDYLSGTTFKRVTTGHGRSKKVEMRLEEIPKTPEEQAIFDRAKFIFSDVLEKLGQIQQFDPVQLTQFRPIIQELRNIHQERKEQLASMPEFSNINQFVETYKNSEIGKFEDSIAERRRELQRHLADQGVTNDTVFGTMLGNFDYEAQRSRMAMMNELQQTGLALKQNAFNLNEQVRANQAAIAEAEFNARKNNRSEELENRATSLQQQALLGQFAKGNVIDDRFNKAIRTNPAGLSLAQNANENAHNINAYNSTVNAQNAQYQNQMAAYNNQPMSLFETALNLGVTGAGAYFGGPTGALTGNLLGKNLTGGKR